jgi:putative hydroxymethylpyrimidine transport system substrate-binding protein
MKKINIRRLVLNLFALLSPCLVLITCSKPPAGSSGALREIRVRLDWTPWAPHAALYAAAAHEIGYFEEEGLKVSMYVPPDPEATTKLVASGRDDIGISYMTDTLLAREQGFSVTSVAALVAHPLNCIMALKTSGIDKPHKLKGKTIGTTGIPSDEAFLAGVLLRNGVQKGDYKLINIGFNLAQALKTRQVDAIVGAYWPWEGINLEQEGYPIYIMKLQESGVPDYYELVLICGEKMIIKTPELLRKFLKAMVRGQEFVKAHPESAVSILHKVSPDLKLDFLSASLQEMLPLMEFPNGLFRQDGKKWEELINFMTAGGLLKTRMVASSVFTNDFLPKLP